MCAVFPEALYSSVLEEQWGKVGDGSGIYCMFGMPALLSGRIMVVRSVKYLTW